MIGSRVTAAVVALASIVAFGGGGPRPEVEDGARRDLASAAQQTEAAISDLRERLTAAIDAGRIGAARVVAGAEASPGEPLLEAAAAVEASLPAATALSRARERTERLRRALDPAAGGLPEAVDAGDLGSIAGQLRAAATAGEDFARMRRRAEGLTGILARALDELASGDLDAARERAAAARSELEALQAWEVSSDTLPVWLETVGAMIGAVERTLDAIARGDAEAADAAVAAIAELEEDAPSADRALRIAVGEVGSGLTAIALGRLARVVTRLDALATAVASVRREATE